MNTLHFDMNTYSSPILSTLIFHKVKAPKRVIISKSAHLLQPEILNLYL